MSMRPGKKLDPESNRLSGFMEVNARGSVVGRTRIVEFVKI